MGRKIHGQWLTVIALGLILGFALACVGNQVEDDTAGNDAWQALDGTLFARPPSGADTSSVSTDYASEEQGGEEEARPPSGADTSMVQICFEVPCGGEGQPPCVEEKTEYSFQAKLMTDSNHKTRVKLTYVPKESFTQK